MKPQRDLLGKSGNINDVFRVILQSRDMFLHWVINYQGCGNLRLFVGSKKRLFANFYYF
jgi:hypothetical protein